GNDGGDDRDRLGQAPCHRLESRRQRRWPCDGPGDPRRAQRRL
ncbi:MAG: hypothetical protein AVDCRST_MAG19-961, partial [uncultured Thermomicrobiales bacterium]